MTTTRAFLSRAEAAEYVQSHGLPLARGTLHAARCTLHAARCRNMPPPAKDPATTSSASAASTVARIWMPGWRPNWVDP